MLTKRAVGLVMVLIGLGVISAGQAAAQVVTPATGAATSLSDAIERTSSVDFRLVARGGSETFSGVIDVASQAASVSYSDGTNTLTFVSTPDTLYASGLPDFAEKTVALQVADLAARCKFAEVADAAVGLSLASAATTVEQTTGNTVQGTLDLSKVVGPANTMATVRHLQAITAGDTSAVPFSAMLENGYITLFQATFAKANADGSDLVYVLQLSAIGIDNKVDQPDARNVVNAPPELYGA